LYIACITSVADFGIQLWWNPKKTPQSIISKFQWLQNLATKWLLGAFKSFPTIALELEAAILSSSVRFTKIYRNYNIKTLNFHSLYLVVIKVKKALSYDFKILKTKPTQLENLILSLKTFEVNLSKIE